MQDLNLQPLIGRSDRRAAGLALLHTVAIGPTRKVAEGVRGTPSAPA